MPLAGDRNIHVDRHLGEMVLRPVLASSSLKGPQKINSTDKHRDSSQASIALLLNMKERKARDQQTVEEAFHRKTKTKANEQKDRTLRSDKELQRGPRSLLTSSGARRRCTRAGL